MSERDRTPTPAAVRIYRMARLAFHLVHGVLTVAFLFPFYGSSRRRIAVGRWSAAILADANVVLQVHGAPPEAATRPRVLVANHVSWLDIQVIHAIWQVRFVAKSEVRRWPVIGWLSARTGTLFIERGSGRHAARINRSIHAAFVEGDAVGVFPEGATTHGDVLGKFHASLLQPAVDEQALVYPVALRYAYPDGSLCIAASYVGDESLAQSIRAILAVPRIEAHLFFLQPIDAIGKTRRELAEQTREAIAIRISQPASGTTPGIPAGPPA